MRSKAKLLCSGFSSVLSVSDPSPSHPEGRDRVHAAVVPGVAAADASRREPRALPRTVHVHGLGASVIVYKSMANGRSQRVESSTATTGSETFVFDLTLTPFIDGGWYWYDVVAADEDAVVTGAEWTAQVPADRAEHGTLDIAITTGSMVPSVAWS